MEAKQILNIDTISTTDSNQSTRAQSAQKKTISTKSSSVNVAAKENVNSPSKQKKKWSSEDEKIGINMLAKNKTHMEIAQTLQRSSSTIRNHFDNYFFFCYRKKQVSQLWETFNSTHQNFNHNVNHNKIDISNLKINDYVYIMMDHFPDIDGVATDDFYDDIECDVFYKTTRCIGWIKSKIYDIKSDEFGDRIRIKIGDTGHKGWVELNNSKIQLSGGNLYYYDAYNNKICCAEKFSKKYHDHENEKRVEIFNPTLIDENNIKCYCSCDKLMIQSKIKDVYPNHESKNGDIIECVNCKKKYKSKHTVIYHSYYKNNVHFTACDICKICAKLQMVSKLCAIINCISFDEFDIDSNQMNQENILNKQSYDYVFNDEYVDDKQQNNNNKPSFIGMSIGQIKKLKRNDIIHFKHENNQWMLVKVYIFSTMKNKLQLRSIADDKFIANFNYEGRDDNEIISNFAECLDYNCEICYDNNKINKTLIDNSNNSNKMNQEKEVQQQNDNNNKASFISMSIGQIKKLKRNDIIHFQNENNQWMLVKVYIFYTMKNKLQLRRCTDDKFISNFNYEYRNDTEIISNFARCSDDNCEYCYDNKINQTLTNDNSNNSNTIKKSLAEDQNKQLMSTPSNKNNNIGMLDLLSSPSDAVDDIDIDMNANENIDMDDLNRLKKKEKKKKKKLKKLKKKKLKKLKKKKKKKLQIFENIDDDMMENEDPNIDVDEDIDMSEINKIQCIENIDKNILLNTNTNTCTHKKRSFNEMNAECKEQEQKLLIINQPKIKKRRINNEEFNNFDADITTLSLEEAGNLEKGDFIDHQHRNGKYMEAKIIHKRGSDLRIKYLNLNDTIWSDYENRKYELDKFARYKSISNRPSHRLNHLKIGDTVYLNLKISFQNKEKYKKLGWIKCIVQEKDNGQIKVEFIWQNEVELYWVHLDNKDVINDDEKWVQMQMKRYIPESIKRQIAADQEWVCACCKKALSPNFEIDHIKPVHEGGTNDRRNCQALNPPCHRNKTNKDRIGDEVNVNPKELEKDKLKLWLEKCGLVEKVYDIFIKNDIDDMDTVQLLDLDSLKSIGINTIGLQLKLIKNINELKQTCLKKL